MNGETPNGIKWDDGELFGWRKKQPTSYLRPTGERRRGCDVFEKNPHWDGVLRQKASARNGDRLTSHEAAASGDKDNDMHKTRIYIDNILWAQNGTIVSTELREYALEGIDCGEIDTRGLAANVRAESIRRRFSDFCPD